ncbi:hypothetical protein Tco_0787982 [Tanacetum coccineum]
MPTEMELTLEQTQQGVSYEVSYDESNTYVLERFNTTAGNPVKKILLKLNLSDHRLFKDGGGVSNSLGHLIVLSALRRSDNENMPESILTGFEGYSTKPGEWTNL